MTSSCSDASCMFQFGERLGIFVNILASTSSAISVTGLLVYAALKRWRSLKQVSEHDKSDASAFILLLSLLTGDFIQGIGGMPSWKWMLDAHLTEGALCTFQGLFLNIAHVATALSALSIALHTFCVLILRWKFSRLALRIVVAGIWCLTGLIIGACSRGRSHYYGNAGYWCWITEDYFVERIAGGYLWLWIAFIVMIVLYAFMFLVMKGIIKIDNEAGDDLASQQEREDESESEQVAYLMLFYPAVYLFCIAPMSISRWVGWSNPDYHSPAAIIFSHIIFTLSGVFNVILFSITRPSLVVGSTDSLGNSGGVEMGQQQPSGDVQQTTPPASDSVHDPIAGPSYSFTGRELESSEGHTLPSAVGLGGEHDLDNHLPRMSSPARATDLQTGWDAHIGHNHGRLPDC